MNWKFWKKSEPIVEDYAPSRQQLRAYNKQLQSNLKRSFKAAEESRFLTGWTSHPVHINQLIRQHLTTLRARARAEAQSNDYVKQYIRIMKNNIVGSQGFSHQAKVTRARGTMDEPANTAIESAYKKSGRAIDITGGISRRENLGMIISALITDGEYLAIKYRGKSYGESGYQIEPIDPHLLDVTVNKELSGGRKVRMGIEYDSRNKPLRYYFREYDEQSYGYSNYTYRIVPADRVIHVFYREFVGQERGIPWLATTLFSLKSLDAYDEAAVVAARIGASAMGFFRSEGGEEYKGEEQGENGATITSFEPGTMEDIGNRTFQEFNPNYPHQQYADFKKAQLRKVSSGLGASYETLANDREGVNYTSIRHGTLEDRENWKTIQDMLIEKFILPDYENWLEMALLMGSIRIGARPLSRPVDDYMPVVFQGRRWDWVDPSKDMDAYQKEYDLKAISISEIIRKRGRDPDEVFNEIAEEREKMEAMGITVGDVFASAAQQQPAPQPERMIERAAPTEQPAPVFNITMPEFKATIPVQIDLPEPVVTMEANIEVPEVRAEAPAVNVTVEPTPVEITNQVEPAAVEVTNNNIVETPVVNVENKIDNNKTITFSHDGNGKLTSAETKSKSH